LTKVPNTAGLYAVEYYIRGKPWTVAVDDYLFMYNQAGGKYKYKYPEYNFPVYAQPDT
jgi:hypothetical protein